MGMWLTRYPERKTVVVNTKSKTVFRGVLWQRTRRHLVLKNVVLLSPGGGAAPMDGEVLVPAENVEFIQVVGA